MSKECLRNINGTIEERLLRVSPDGLSAVRSIFALQVVGTVVEFVRMVRLERSEWSGQFALLAHHIVTASGMFVTLYNRRGVSGSCTMIATEWSTMFLNILLFSKHPSYKPWVTQHMPWLELIGGLGLW